VEIIWERCNNLYYGPANNRFGLLGLNLLWTFVIKSYMCFVCICILYLSSGIVLLQKKISLSCYLWLSLILCFFLSFSVKKAKLQGPPGNGLFASYMKQLWLYNCLRFNEEKITPYSVNCHSDECLLLK